VLCRRWVRWELGQERLDTHPLSKIPGYATEIQRASQTDSQTAMVDGVWSLDREGCIRKEEDESG